MRQSVYLVLFALALSSLCSTTNPSDRPPDKGKQSQSQTEPENPQVPPPPPPPPARRRSFWQTKASQTHGPADAGNGKPKERGPLSRIFNTRNDKNENAYNPPKKWKTLKASYHARHTSNPIRTMSQTDCVMPNPAIPTLMLSLGDPTKHMRPHKVIEDAMVEIVRGNLYNGYGKSVGITEAREAIVKHFSKEIAPFHMNDVILASGASHALQMIIEAIGERGDNILVPVPGFPLYKTHANAEGIETIGYKLDMDRGEIDLVDLQEKINEKTRAIIVNNPSNPSGFVFSRRHLIDILRIAEEYKLVVISDEIYGDLVYDKAKFFSMPHLNKNVPIVVIDGIAKRYLVPGWRLGWMIFHNRHGVFTNIIEGVTSLTQKIVGPSMLAQGVLPLILERTPAEHFDRIRTVLERNAKFLYEKLRNVKGLKPLRPQGAMYMMVGIDESMLGDEPGFLVELIEKQSLYCPPGKVFGLRNWFRILMTSPPDEMEDAANRIIEFANYRRKKITRQIFRVLTTNPLTTAKKSTVTSPPVQQSPSEPEPEQSNVGSQCIRFDECSDVYD